MIDLDAPTVRWLHQTALRGERLRHTQPLTGGYNNESILLSTHDGTRYVLRRHRAAGGSGVRRNPCAVEAALLGRVRGRVPAPDVVAADPDGAATQGRPVLVYRYIEGVTVAEALAKTHPRASGGLGRAVGATLARIGAIVLPRPGHFEGTSLAPAVGACEATADLPGFVDACIAAATRTPPDRGRAAGRPRPDAADLVTLRALAARSASWCAAVSGARSLVHNDFNPKNLLVTRINDDWRVVAVLDWELAFSGSPLVDVGNMLRFTSEYPPAYVDGFTEGFRGAGGLLPPGWRHISAALDLFALADILTDPPQGALLERARSVLAAQMSRDAPDPAGA